MDIITTKPRGGNFLPVIFSNIPHHLRAHPRWVCWKLEDGRKKPRTPYDRRASSTDPSTWSTLDACARAYLRGYFHGVGFVLGGIGLTVVDIDHGIVNGQLEPWAADVLSRFPGTYAEMSPSGDGHHIWCAGVKAQSRCESVNGGVEIYDAGRYMTVTGHAIGTSDITNCQAAIDAFESDERYFPRVTPTTPTATICATTNADLAAKLAFIPADAPRNDVWIKVAAALKAEGFSFDVFHAWSKTALTQYKGEADCLAAWNSIRQPRCTMGTINHFAEQGGYVPPPLPSIVRKLQRRGDV